jgi:hypothetical protein
MKTAHMILYQLHSTCPPPSKPNSRFIKSRLLVLLSLGLFIVSLFLPALVPLSPYRPPVNGMSCVLLGAFCILRLFLLPFCCWLPNAFYLVAYTWLYRKQYGRGLLWAAAGCCLSGLPALLHQLPLDEAGNRYAFHLGPGYYIWLGAQVLLLVQLLAGYRGAGGGKR